MLDWLVDVRHDLGKYLVLPLAMMESDPTADQVADRVRMAVLETRAAPHGHEGAEEIWARLLASCPVQNPAQFHGWSLLVSAVERVLAMGRSGQWPTNRQEALKVLGAVSIAAGELMTEVRHGR